MGCASFPTGGAIRTTPPDPISLAVGNVAFSKSGKVEGVELEACRQAEARPVESGSSWLVSDPELIAYESGKGTLSDEAVEFGGRGPLQMVSRAA